MWGGVGGVGAGDGERDEHGGKHEGASAVCVRVGLRVRVLCVV